MKIFYSILILIFYTNISWGEVELVTIYWRKATCPVGCTKLLHERFNKIKEIESYEIYPEEGRAEIVWQPNTRFSFIPLNNALKYVGLIYQEVRLKVRGNLLIKGDDYYLVSINDNTPILLLGRVQPLNPTQNVEEANPAGRKLSYELKQKLLEAKRQYLTTIISGLLFLPERSPPSPIQLVIDQLSFEEKKEEEKKVDKGKR